MMFSPEHVVTCTSHRCYLFILECMQHIVELALWVMRLCVLSLIWPIIILPNVMTAKFLICSYSLVLAKPASLKPRISWLHFMRVSGVTIKLMVCFNFLASSSSYGRDYLSWICNCLCWKPANSYLQYYLGLYSVPYTWRPGGD